MEIDKMTPKEMVKRAEYLLYESGKDWENRDEIFRLLYAAYNQKYGRAAAILGQVYKEEEITARDDEASDRFIRIAAEWGDPLGCRELAFKYYNNPEKYEEYMRKAAQGGDPFGMCVYGELLLPSFPGKGIYWLKKASRKHYYQANHDLAVFYLKGDKFYPPDFVQARKYIMKNAKVKFYYSITLIGNFYDFGYGMRKNYKKAREWYQYAIDNLNDDDAMGYLGLHYIYGKGGIKKDYQKGFQLLSKIEDGYNIPSTLYFELARCYEKGIGTKKDLEKAKVLYARAGILR